MLYAAVHLHTSFSSAQSSFKHLLSASIRSDEKTCKHARANFLPADFCLYLSSQCHLDNGMLKPLTSL